MIIKLPECPKFLDEGATPAAKEIGITLANIFYVIFSPINYPVEKLKIRHAENLKKYQLDIQYELMKIPEEKLIEPQLNIVGPALEASKFYIEKEDIRKMFAKLITSSMNVDTTAKAHPAFIEIIKQITPDEAKVLNILSISLIIPYICIEILTGARVDRYYDPKFFSLIGDKAKCYYPDLYLSYLDNLQRLGLLEFNIIDNDADFMHSKLYQDNLHLYDELENHTFIQDKIQKIGSNNRIVYRGIIEFTDLGNQFNDTCIK